MAVRHVIKIYSGYEQKKHCEYRTVLSSDDYDSLDEMLDEVSRELGDNHERLLEGESDDDDSE